MKTPDIDRPGRHRTRAREPCRGLTLDEAERLALERNSEIAALACGRRVGRLAPVRQAGAVPNPVLALEAEDFGFDRPGWDDSQLTLTLEQPIQLGGKRGGAVAKSAGPRGMSPQPGELEIRARDRAREVRRSFAAACTRRSASGFSTRRSRPCPRSAPPSGNSCGPRGVRPSRSCGPRRNRAGAGGPRGWPRRAAVAKASACRAVGRRRGRRRDARRPVDTPQGRRRSARAFNRLRTSCPTSANKPPRSGGSSRPFGVRRAAVSRTSR